MRQDHRPYQLKRLLGHVEAAWTRHFIAPQLDALGVAPMIMKPWNFKIHGRHISLGDAVHVVTAADRTVRLTTWQHAAGNGRIDVGDYALLCPGVRIDSASSVTIGTNTMLAAGVYITDADWHDIYDRSRPIGTTRPVVLEENTWIGDGSIVCKGVTVGKDSVVGAGSVVSKSIPPGVIAAGNPAVVVRPLDTGREVKPRSSLLADHNALAADIDRLERLFRKDNSWLKWLRTRLAPRRDD